MTQNNITHHESPPQKEKPFSEMLRLRREKLHREFAGCIFDRDFDTVISSHGNCGKRIKRRRRTHVEALNVKRAYEYLSKGKGAANDRKEFR